MSHLKTMPPVNTVEPKIKKHFSACPIFGAGDFNKIMEDLDNEDFLNGAADSEDSSGLNAGSLLKGTFGNAHLESEGDYYSIMPFGADPPVPHIQPVAITSNGLYNQEIEALTRDMNGSKDSRVGSGASSPDLFYR